uniref:Uncharacterized protein n=1 Tax=Oryza sativa subsp. japonica TaxID=39947 RepID=Q5Z9S5_ORYSJ|nr:hypothetical protein [Oryza sativa Japonica Group]
MVSSSPLLFLLSPHLPSLQKSWSIRGMMGSRASITNRTMFPESSWMPSASTWSPYSSAARDDAMAAVDEPPDIVLHLPRLLPPHHPPDPALHVAPFSLPIPSDLALFPCRSCGQS